MGLVAALRLPVTLQLPADRRDRTPQLGAVAAFAAARQYFAVR
ncbi:hypothetical protein [Amycolatopsis sp. cmx-4-83]